MTQGRGRLYEVAEAQRAALLAGERQAAGELVRAYGGVWQRIQRALTYLLNEEALIMDAGSEIGLDWLLEYNRLALLLGQVEDELRIFAAFAEPLIVQQQAEAVEAALRHTEQLVRVATNTARTAVAWVQLPTAAVEDLIGFTAAGSPLRALLDALGPAASATVRDTLIQGLALGLNPTMTAEMIRTALGGNLARALTISRTETLRAYREASRRSYEANADVVDGWVWNCALTERTCAACWAMHGTWHPATETLASHPNCRCSMLPHVKELPGLGAQALPESGPAQFARLATEQQDVILGGAAGRAYRAGIIRLEDVVGHTYNRDWGPGRRVRSLREILGA